MIILETIFIKAAVKCHNLLQIKLKIRVIESNLVNKTFINKYVPVVRHRITSKIEEH